MFVWYRYKEEGFGRSEVKKVKSYHDRKHTVQNAFNRAAGLVSNDSYLSLAEWTDLIAPGNSRV